MGYILNPFFILKTQTLDPTLRQTKVCSTGFLLNVLTCLQAHTEITFVTSSGDIFPVISTENTVLLSIVKERNTLHE